jgi:hypothetical protein
VAIYRLLQRSAFGPEDTKRLVAACELALVQLELKDRDDPLTETTAKLVVEAGQTRAKDPQMICDLALRWLRTDRAAS